MKVCSVCGMSFSQVQKEKMFGCPECFYTFEEEFVYLSITFTYNNESLTKEFEYVTEANPDKVFEKAFEATFTLLGTTPKAILLWS